jgi:HTH-type transcriptional regulator/antitoxin HigA
MFLARHAPTHAEYKNQWVVAAMRKTVNRRPITDHYLELIREFPLRQIRTNADFDRASEMIVRLAVYNEGTLPPGQQDYLDALTILIEDYDRRHPSFEKSDPIDLLKHLMEESGMTVTALGKLLGSKSAASEILHGKRSLSKAHIVKLANHFKLNTSAFLPN